MEPSDTIPVRIVHDELIPGALVGGRFRLACVAAQHEQTLLFNALDEQSRRRVRVRVTACALQPSLLTIDHPALPSVLAWGQLGERWWVALEWFDGEPIALPTDDRGPASRARLRGWAMAAIHLSDALDLIHERAGACHGGLGLHSLWLGNDGRIRIVDATAPEPVLSHSALLWASPERIRGEPPTRASDIYSLAAIFYGLAHGHPPFGEDPGEAQAGHLSRPPPEGHVLTDAFDAILRRAMAKQPGRRPGGAAELRAAMIGALRELDPQKPAATFESAELDPDLTIDPAPPRALVEEGEESGHHPLVMMLVATGLSVPAGLVVSVVACGALGLLVTSTVILPLAVFVDVPPEPEVAAPTEPAIAEASEATDPSGDGDDDDAQSSATAATQGGGHASTSLEIVPPVPARPETQRVPVEFDYDSWKPRVLVEFEDFSSFVEDYEGPVKLTGHTDTFGSRRANHVLGLGRAWAVQRLLVARGIEEARLPIDSKGETEPLTTEPGAAAARLNRRVMADFIEGPGEAAE
ncbi:MAG TPA: hypothetical protein ENK18_08390 [Deltaproteobacteria bacterium]|nr:hypothetical protein [Deltaproteobacteria bacterium]